MGMFFTGKELLDVAVNIEKSGAAFYETMVNCAKSKKAKTAFKYLADQEKQHIKAYQSMLKAVADAPPPETYTEEYDAVPQVAGGLRRVFQRRSRLHPG